MNQIIGVFIGGGLGSVSRYLMSLLIMGMNPSSYSMMATGIVNVLGSLLAGVVVSKAIFSDYQTYIIAGFLGGFTTFSAFSLEIYKTIQKGNYWLAIVFTLLVIIGGVLGVIIGQKI